MIVNMNNETMDQAIMSAEHNATPVALTLEQRLKEIINAVAAINWTAQLVQQEFETIVAENKDHSREQIVEMMKALEQEFIDQANAKNQPTNEETVMANIIEEGEREEEEFRSNNTND